MSHFVITLGCEYGSGGPDIGRMIADSLGIEFYDRDLIDKVVEELGVDRELVEKADTGDKVRYEFDTNLGPRYANLTNRVIAAQFDVIRKFAEKSSCLIVGRCSDYILKDRDDCLNIFVYAPEEYRVRHIMEQKHVKEKDLYPETLKAESLDRIYRSFLNLLPLSAKHYRKLKTDGWSDSLIKRSLIRSINFKRSYDESKKYYTDSFERFRITSTLVNEYGPLDGVPGFYLNDENKWTFVGRQGMLIPIYDLHGNLYRLRLRLDKPDVDENGKERNKYKNFSSFHSEDDGFGVLKNTYNHGCRAGSCIGLYYNPNLDSSDMCYITEGEKKAILTNDYLRYPVISLPGTGTYNKLYDLYDGINAINFLKSSGCDTTVVAYDADKIYNQQVLRYEQKLVQLLQGEGFSVYIASWNAGFGKGIDDILPLGILPTLKPV